MLRALRIFAITLASVAGVLALAYRIWLAQQPPQTRSAVEAFTLREFLTAVQHEISPPPAQDFAGFGRREYARRGHSPWVLRSSLDGRPRMLSLALAPSIWLSYSTETASIHQLWRGEIELTGPAFDERHGGEPLSRGAALFRGDAATAWRVRGAKGWEPAHVRWRAYGVEGAGNGRAWLRFEVSDGAGNARIVTERPEQLGARGSAATEVAPLGLERVFEVASGDGPEIALALGAAHGRIEGDAAIEAGELLRLAPGRTRIAQWFDGAGEPIASVVLAPQPSAFAQHDCLTCHHTTDRIVGPAWQEIAARNAGANRAAAGAALARSIREGSAGRWGQTPMPAHPWLTHADALALAQLVLETEHDALLEPESAAGDGEVTYAYDTEPRLTSLHPALRVLPIAVPGFTPRVGGLAWLPDGRLAVATWDRDGAIVAIEGWSSASEGVRVTRIAEGLHEPLGLAFADGALHVIQKQEITRLVDGDGDSWIDEYRALANDWSATSNFHEFGFGLPAVGDALYAGLSVCVLNGGKSCGEQAPDRGKLARVSLVTGEVEFVASGFRTPNGVAAGPDGAVYVTDNQGDWLPASKLIRIEPGADYGWRAPGVVAAERPTPPALWLPQNEIGNSPTQPVVLTRGPYAGQLLWGDVYNGGLKRGALEDVAGRAQGAAFHFSGGLRGPVNRLLAAPDGSLVAGEIGSYGNWGELGKAWHGLELLRFADEAAFEPLGVHARRGGFDIVFTRPLAQDSALDPKRFQIKDWRYVPTASYGGPKHDPRELAVSAVRISADRRVLSLDVAGLEAGRVVYLHLDRGLRSERGEKPWVNEAWYTLNALPSAAAAAPAASADPHNKLTDGERAEGWELLFDGRSFAGWKVYGSDGDAIEGWVVRDGAFEFTRNVSFAGLAWNHLNPWGKPALDLMSKQRFRNFELSIEWRIEPGGNSGIFYAVPDETDRLAWTRGLEMQVLDDARHADGRLAQRRAGDLYDLATSERRVVRAAGEWNRARIRVEGARIEHWLNGVRVVSVERGTPEWERALAASKFADTPGFGAAREGHIVLQDHGDAVWYRNIKLRRLPD
jgi:cytochrome c551/c552